MVKVRLAPATTYPLTTVRLTTFAKGYGGPPEL
jgi:hypothetical protein